MIAFDLTDEQKALQKMARDFAEKEIRPVAEKLDRSENLLKDFPWDMVKKASKLGLRTIGLPKEYGADIEARSESWNVCLVAQHDLNGHSDGADDSDRNKP